MSVAFTGAAAKMTAAGLQSAASSIGTTPRLLRAVIAVETSGKGFDGQGRLRMLFEPGQFYRRCPPSTQAAAVAAGVALASMAGHRYPADSYPLLATAMQIHQRTAIECASWGLPQIMGFNHAMAGFDSAEQMIAAFVQSEDAQVRGLANFIRAAGLIAALNAQNWPAVARGYNGKGYTVNAYDRKLEAAYARLGDEPVAVAVAAPKPEPLPPFQQPTVAGPHILPVPAPLPKPSAWAAAGAALKMFFFKRNA